MEPRADWPNATPRGLPDQSTMGSLISRPSLYEHYCQVARKTTKWSNYFAIYDDLLAKYRGKPITFVEVGVLNGGSLQMWRSFLGREARIIGVDLNPHALQMEVEGFEVFIGDQS